MISAKIFSARRYPDRIHFQLNKCTNCGLIFSSPIFSSVKIAKLYKDSFLSYSNQVTYVKNTYMDLFNKLTTKISKNPYVLEIGCANGFFLKELRKKGIKKLFGVEPSKKMVDGAADYLKTNIKQSLFKKGLFPKKTFDLACCFHTLDHVINPNELVKETYEVLKERGIALFVLHDTSALSVKLFGEKSPIFDIEHIYLFNKKNVAMLFKNHGFTILKIDDLKNTYPISYWIKMAGIPRFFKEAALKAITFTRLENLTFTLKGGNIYILAQKNQDGGFC